MKRAVGVVLIALLAAISLSCRGGKVVYPESNPGSTAGSIVVNKGDFKIGDEKYRGDYGTIAVPENRNKTGSRLIQIPFLRVHSKSGNPAEPVFGLAGGPGQSNMSWDRGKIWTFLPNHDFIIVGYRGIDGSVVLDCPEVGEALKASGDPLSEETLRRIGAAWTAAGKRLLEKGIDLDGYNMIECIEDIEDVRKALGYERIDLLSESYGTRVAYLYGLEHPQSIYRSAMLGVNPPGHFVWDAKTIDRQLRYYSALWSEDSAMTAKVPDLYAAMKHVLNRMPERWLFIRIDPGKVRVVTLALLFNRGTAAYVFDAYVAAAKGDPSGLALMSLAYDFAIPSMISSGDLASKAVSADFDSTADYGTGIDTSQSPLGSPMTRLAWGPAKYGRLPMNMIPEGFRKLQSSDVTTLLVSGTLDFSTPREFATNELLPYLRNGKQVVLAECGHVNDMWYVNVTNTRRLLTSFYDTGVADTSRNSYKPMDFRVTWGFATLANVGAAVIALLILGVLGLVFKLWRKFSSRTKEGSRA